MPLASFEPIDALWIALSVFFVLVGVGLAYVLVRLGGTVGRLSSFLQGLEREVLPVIGQVVDLRHVDARHVARSAVAA